MAKDNQQYIDQSFYENIFGVDTVADDTLPDFQRAVVKASTVANNYCSNRIDNPGIEHLSDRQRFLVKKATGFLVQHFLNTGELDDQRGSASFSGAGSNYTYTNNLGREETAYIPKLVVDLLRQAGLLERRTGLSMKQVEGEDKEDGYEEMDPDNLWATLANPYMKAVKHNDAAKDAKKNKKPIWIGPKSFRYSRVPKTIIEDGVERNNRNLATLNMLNWFVHNSYVEIPMSQHMALYFDSKAVNAVSDTISSGLGGILGGIGMGGIIGGMFGGPLGALFGGAIGNFLGRKALSSVGKFIARLLGALVGIGAGFWWNAKGNNSLSDDEVRQLPGFMTLLPRDKLEFFIKTLFHTGYFGKQHARLPYNYLHTEPQSDLSAILGKSEISFTFTLTDRIVINRYNQDSGASMGTYEGTTADIGQDKGDGGIPLIDENARLLKGQMSYGEDNKEDERVDFQGYGYIIEGFNIKCCGKVPYTITFYSPEGYMYGDEDGNLKGDKSKDEWENPYNRPVNAVWRGQYLTEALFRDDNRLWQNTKNLAKPHHYSYAPFRYPRALLPTPPVDWKYPTKWLGEETLRLKTLYVEIDSHSSKFTGDMENPDVIKWRREDTNTENRLGAYWIAPKRPVSISS